MRYYTPDITLLFIRMWQFLFSVLAVVFAVFVILHFYAKVAVLFSVLALAFVVFVILLFMTVCGKCIFHFPVAHGIA